MESWRKRAVRKLLKRFGCASECQAWENANTSFIKELETLPPSPSAIEFPEFPRFGREWNHKGITPSLSVQTVAIRGVGAEVCSHRVRLLSFFGRPNHRVSWRYRVILCRTDGRWWIFMWLIATRAASSAGTICTSMLFDSGPGET